MLSLIPPRNAQSGSRAALCGNDGRLMAKLSIAPVNGREAKMDDVVERFARRLQTTPPGMCPLALQLSLLRASGAQTCGKCVPCRDGIPRMIQLLERIVACNADAADLEQLTLIAQMVRDTSDCAIGYEAAAAVLAGMQAFAAEYESHIENHMCTPDIEQKVPCESMCPAHVNAPAYIALVAQGDYAGAVNIVRKDNPFPTACAFVCEHPCEVRCRRTIIDAPINIRGVKRYAVDHAPADKTATPKPGVGTGHRIAVIGGGPSGLTCAYFLALMGHSVVVFEQHKELGGMLRYGIPEYRFPRERLDEDIRGILATGDIQVVYDHVVRATSMKEITRAFDAVYLSIGAQAGKQLDIDGGDADGVISAVDMLGEIGDGAYPDYTGKKVAVVGGGNVAIDCARTAIRAGAQEVSIVYRRRRQDMPALPDEIESAIAEGIEMVTLQAPASVEVNEDGHCTALVTQPQMVGPVKAGRPAPVEAAKPQQRLEADIILVAIGQRIDSDPFVKFGMKVEWGRFKSDGQLVAEGFDNVFVGGDCQSGPSTVISAVAAGKVAARNIDECLGYHHKLDCGVGVPDAVANDRMPRGRVELAERPARERRCDYGEVEVPMSEQEVIQECKRCLRCDIYGCGVLEGGRNQYA